MRALMAALLFVGLSAACQRSHAPPLSESDLSASGLNLDSSCDEMTVALGRPDSVSERPHSFPIASDGTPVVPTFHFRDIVIRMGDDGPIERFTLTGPSRATSRGLRVGDPAARVLELYGEPVQRVDETWRYPVGDGATGIRVHLVAGAVWQIELGYLGA